MNIKQIGSNQSEIHLANGTVVLVSYKTPVAAYNPRGHDVGGFPRCITDKSWSTTTSRHISAWLGSKPGKYTIRKPQAFFDTLLAAV